MHIEGPVETTNSLPFGSAMTDGGTQATFLKEFDYVEEEFFVSGTANVYGPNSRRMLEPGEDSYTLRPLSTVRQTDVPYKTRALVIRPSDPQRFSGVVHAIPFHNLNAQASVERNLLRNGDVWVGIECCSGTRFGKEEIPSGGVANLVRSNPERYGDLHMAGGDPADWGHLTAGAVGRAFATLNFMRASPEMEVFVQELFRSYGQGPDIFFDVVQAVRDGKLLPAGPPVRRVYTSGASGGSQILRPMVEYHHDRRVTGSAPPIDGYLIMVGVVPDHRPQGAALVIFQTEAEAMRQISDGGELPVDTDDPPFRYYEVPGTGHMFSAQPHGDRDPGVIGKVLPPGIQGLNAREASTEYEAYDKYNTPIVWALWDAMYRWLDGGTPMPRSERITRDPGAPDGVGRDRHGNALGGLRTPWVDVPDATYVARMSEGNPLAPGMKRFTPERMAELYGSQDGYDEALRCRLEEMVRDRWLLAEDLPLVLGS